MYPSIVGTNVFSHSQNSFIKQKCRGTVSKGFVILSSNLSGNSLRKCWGNVLFPGKVAGPALALSAVKADIYIVCDVQQTMLVGLNDEHSAECIFKPRKFGRIQGQIRPE